MIAMRPDVAAIIPAAGASRRFGGMTSKPFVQLNQRPLLWHVLSTLRTVPAIGWIVVVVRPADEARVRSLIGRSRWRGPMICCTGGPSRAASVARGFAKIPPPAQWVLIHDGARPCVTRQVVERTIRAARRSGAVACGLPAPLTVKAVDNTGRVRLTLDRETLWFVQTPQVFSRSSFAESLRRAHDQMDHFPDDAAMLESAGFHVRMVPGDPLNIKVTTKDDLFLAEAILHHKTR